MNLYRLEQVQLKSLSSMAKMLGTGFSVIGAGCMALLRGPKLLNIQLHPTPSNNSLMLNSFEGYDTWIIGCLFIFASMCCWSCWLILQVFTFLISYYLKFLYQKV